MGGVVLAVSSEVDIAHMSPGQHAGQPEAWQIAEPTRDRRERGGVERRDSDGTRSRTERRTGRERPGGSGVVPSLTRPLNQAGEEAHGHAHRGPDEELLV